MSTVYSNPSRLFSTPFWLLITLPLGLLQTLHSQPINNQLVQPISTPLRYAAKGELGELKLQDISAFVPAPKTRAGANTKAPSNKALVD